MQNKTLQRKRALRTALLVLLLGVVELGKGYAYDFEAVCPSGQTLYYNIIDATNHYVALTFPNDLGNPWWYDQQPNGSITLSGTVQNNGINYTLTEIGDYAFYGCGTMTGSLVIPNSVTRIGEGAFQLCEGFTGNLTISNSVTSIGNSAFGQCYRFNGSLVIPNSVITIGDWAFAGCSSLTSVIAHAETPPSLGYDVFWDVCMGIPVYVSCGNEEVYASTRWGGFSNFYGMCGGEITITANPAEGGTVTGAGYYEGGTTCSITATTNEDYSFINWTKKGAQVSNNASCSIFVAGDASYVANFAQGVNINFVDADVKALCVANWDTNGDGELSYSEAAAVTDLGEVFRNNSTITSFDELQYFTGLTFIGSNAFRTCRSLVSIAIPNSVTSIETRAFSNCFGLTSVDIPNSVISINEYAFQNCTGLTSIAIPSSVISIGFNPFMGCGGGLEQIIVDSENPEYDSRENCNAIIKTSTNELITGCNNTVLLNSIISIGTNAFCNCTGLTSITIPSSVTSIKSYAFQACTGLTSIVIPSTVTSIESNPFGGCSGLVQIVVDSGNPEYDSRENCNAIIKISTNELVTGCMNTVILNSVTSIGNSAFLGCTGLTLLAIPTAVTTIGSSAFSSCSGLLSLTIPHSVTEIGWNAFNNCIGLTSITVLAEAPPSVGAYAFNYVDSTIPITVPCGYVSVYEASDWHNYFTTIVEDCGPHAVIIDENSMNGGNVSTSVTSTELGEEVQLTITPDEGMMLASLIVSNANDPSQTVPVYSIGKNSLIYGFLMPPFDVVITATFGPATAIGENNEASASVYPNPTTDQVTIEAENLKHITISNLLGQTIFNGNASGNAFEYDFSKHKTGIYLIRIETESGVVTKKVTVER